MKRARNIIMLACLVLASAPAFGAQGSGCMPTTGTVSGLTFSQSVNAAFQALISSNSGASAPATDCTAAPVKGQFWVNTSATPNVLQQYDGISWIVLGAIDATNHLWSPPVGGGVASVTAASTTDICAAPSAVQNITGTTAIASLGSGCVIGLRKTLLFNSATPLTYNSTSMILPGQRDYVASPGDMADAIYLGAGNWRVKDISKIDGSSVTNPAVPIGTVLYGDYGTLPAKAVYGTGQAIVRASYPDYFAAATRLQTGTLTAGNNTITGLSNTAGLGAGMPIEGVGIPSGTTIASVTSSTIVMSSPNVATANGAQAVRAFITGYGTGGDSTTIGVKDCVGRGLAGRDSVGTRLASAAAINAGLGSQAKTLDTTNLPPYTPAGTIGNTYNRDGAINAGGSNTTTTGGGTPFWVANGSATFTVTSTFNGTAQGGTSAPFNVVQPTVTAECVVVVLP